MSEKNNQLAEAVNNPLEALSFEHIIGHPLKACAEAQQEAAEACYQYLVDMGLESDQTGMAKYKPVMLSFLFTKDGYTHRISLPLLTVIPVPYLLIDHINLNFQATVTACNDSELKAKFAASTPNVKLDVKSDGSTQMMAKENIDINIRATASGVPYGMSKLIEILQTQMIEFKDQV